jgi:pyruvate kinase
VTVVRQTRIIATLGPVTNSERAIDELIAAGTDVFRLNFSHGTHETHGEMFERVRRAAARAGRRIAIMQDLGGPKIRTGRLERGRPLVLEEGAELRIGTGDFVGGPGRVSTAYAELTRAARPGDRLLLDDGRIELRVESSDGTELVTQVVSGGTLGEQKGINAPGVTLPASALTAKDVVDVRFGIACGVDLVALSFVQTAADLVRAREVMTAAGGGDVPLIAKIERPLAVTNIGEILGACDGIMVARGDLGLEMPLERVPRVQKDLTRRARLGGLPVIVATQVLESMRHAPRPTRAEVSDAANAVDDGVDAIMLAGETAIGAFPTRAVQTLHAVIMDAEAVPPDAQSTPAVDMTGAGHGRALCEAALTLARAGRADAVVAVTRGGKTARLLSALRPRVPIVAATDSERMADRLMLWWGVRPIVCTFGTDVDGTREAIERHLGDRRLLPAGAVVVFVSVNPDLTRTDANFLNLQRLA